MFWVISRYNHNVDYLKDYTEDFIMYDRTTQPINDWRVIPTQNIGSDIRDKFTFIIDNYNHLPPVAVYTKANIFKYITKPEFEKMKDNTIFTPILTQYHKTYSAKINSTTVAPVCYYENGIYWEINNLWYLGAHETKHDPYELQELLGISGMSYVPFAPGSNYILPRENIRKHPKKFYEKLRGYLDWAVYPGEAQIIERGLYTIWK